MPLTIDTAVVELLVRVDRASGRLVGMHVVEEKIISDGLVVESVTLQPARALVTPEGNPDWAALVALIHPDDLAALFAAAQPPP